MADIINQITRNKTLGQIPQEWKDYADGLSPEDRKMLQQQVQQQIQARQQQQKKSQLNNVLLQTGNDLRQIGRLSKIERPLEEKQDNSLNDFIMKEMIKKQMREKPIAEIPQGETPPGLWRDPATGKIHKTPIIPAETVQEETVTPPVIDENVTTEEQLPEVLWRDPVSGKKYKLPGKVDKKEVKPSAAAEKRAVEEQKLSDELGGLLKSFERARTEGRGAVKGFGASGIPGRLAGFGAKISGKAGYLPATNVYNAQRKAFATVVAKAAGEVRPTDEDIKRFVETLPDTSKSDEENALLISDIQEKVAQGGLGNLWFNKKVNLPTQTSGGQGNDFKVTPGGNKYKIIQ